MPQATRRWIAEQVQSLRESDALPFHDILDAGILMNRLVWKYSGHEATSPIDVSRGGVVVSGVRRDSGVCWSSNVNRCISWYDGLNVTGMRAHLVIAADGKVSVVRNLARGGSHGG